MFGAGGLSDPHELRRCIRDLMALSALPAIWRDSEPRGIADSVASALVSMLGADFVHIAVPGKHEEPDVEITYPGRGVARDSLGAVRAALSEMLPGHASEQALSITNPFGDGKMQIAVAPIGFGGEAVLVAGSLSEDFPTIAQRLLLGVGANDATIALERWHAEANERRFVAPIEQSSDLIGFCNMDGRVQYINPEGAKAIGLGGCKRTKHP
jgi:PAS domain-containing protein